MTKSKPDEGTDMGRTQQVGNKNEDCFTLACVLCGDTKELTLTAHRSMSGKVCGWLVGCVSCQPKLCDFHFVDAGTASIKDAECQERVERILNGIENPTDKPEPNRRYTDSLDQQEDACYATWEKAIQTIKQALKKKEGVK